MNEEKIRHLQEVLQAGVNERTVSGASLMILKDGLEECFLKAGMADLEQQIPMQRDTIFRLYSMSKPVTAAAAWLLIERGELDLLDPVSMYLPGFSASRVWDGEALVPAEQPVQIQDLLYMTSGLVYGDEPGIPGEAVERVFQQIPAEHLTTSEAMNRLGSCPLQFEPGSCWLYGTSADVMGAVVEAVSGRTFGEFLKEELFEPLEMKDTGFYVPEDQLSRLAAAYRETPDGLKRYDYNHLAIPFAGTPKPLFESGGAGLFSTIDDFSHFTSMLLQQGTWKGRQILRPLTVRRMTSSSLDPEQQRGMAGWESLKGYTYGNFMRVCREPGQTPMLTLRDEYGWDGWLGCYFANFPHENETFLLMYQRVDSGTTRYTRRLRNVFLADDSFQ